MSNRPLSPHLHIYKLQITSFFSIAHRLTGIFLFLLLIVFSWLFTLYVYFPHSLIVKYLSIFLLSTFAKFLYFVCFISFMYHLYNGIRHLLWDIGINLEIHSILVSAIILVLLLLTSSIVFLLFLL
ncbi:MAG: succinate dehydrogenase, cytochrome b556 subunit [Wolbachia endosymbiont of Fragariocoptes setiger]|nr:succinate dehydrogenase, cytochrome b556 subunit [Wolbachia endosymbiont of Fragariocoptes setiger]